MSIVGWDDSSLSRLLHLDLTTIRHDADRMTRLAVRRAAARIAGEKIDDRELVLPPCLIVRGSTGPVGG